MQLKRKTKTDCKAIATNTNGDKRGNTKVHGAILEEEKLMKPWAVLQETVANCFESPNYQLLTHTHT